MHIIIAVVAGLVSLIMGFLLGITIHRNRLKTTFNNAQQESEQILEEAEKERQKIINDAHREAKQEAKLRRQNAEKDYKQKRSEISKIE
ncbi:MAG: ribonuclease Y, partial [Zetaproteobacteria bacterium]|nr:ribonuclease Y [Pseudobdellovibrionaceae bacterium]